MCQFSYYRLPWKQQAVYCHLLNRVQNGDAIRMGPFDELNYVSATQVKETIFKHPIFLKSNRLLFPIVFQNNLHSTDGNT